MKIVVLMSCWNGQSYIAEQINSILNQSVASDIHLVIRDDGSTDNTVSIVEGIKDPRIELIQGQNLGVVKSFLYLIHYCKKYSPDFIALADQDDFWMPQKLEVGISKIHKFDIPALYCSALNVVGPNLEKIYIHTYKDNITFESSIFSNCATGCTCILNARLLDVMECNPDFSKLIMHDWWLYIYAIAYGIVVYDENSHILYRQHAGNQIGVKSGIWGFFKRLSSFISRPAYPNRVSQSAEFLRLNESKLKQAQHLYLSILSKSSLSFFSRLHFLIKTKPHRRRVVDILVDDIVFLLAR
jgi:rhamnosyltransferase